MIEGVRNLLIFAVVLGSLIFVHELGHFLIAIKLGVRIKEFGIGFPPRLIGTARDKNGNRRWFTTKPPADLDPDDVILSLNSFPLGGFVRPAGEDDPTVADGLAASPKRVRFSVLAAGPAANLLIGLTVFAVGFYTGWPSYTDRIRISGVVRSAPADAAGLLPGDIVLAANGEKVWVSNNRLSQIIHANLGQPVTLTVERGDKTLTFTVVPRIAWPEGQGPVGITLDRDWTLARYPWPEAIVRAGSQVLFQIRETIALPARLIVGTIRPDEVRFVSVVGLKSISDAVVETAVEAQALFPVLQLIGTISVALALTNLLPLPALDGGRILFVLIEAVRGQRIAPEREAYVHIMGLFVLLVIMMFMIINDLVNPVVLR